MSEQQKKQSETAKLDATSAAAALAKAVASAEKSGEKPAPEPAKVIALKTGAAKTEAAFAKDQPSSLPAWRAYAAQAAVVAIAIGLGWTGGSQALSNVKTAPELVPPWAEAATASMRQNQEDLLRLTGDVRVLKGIVESMKESFDQAKVEAAGGQRSLMERVDGIERAAHDITAKIGQVADASGRIERVSTDMGAKLAALSGRLDGIERQAAAAAKPTTAAAEMPPQTGSVPEAKTASKEIPLDGWVLHDVQGGIALVENRSGRLHEVAAGQTLPSVGRVEAIERRGRSWVVVTSKGVIGAGGRWQ